MLKTLGLLAFSAEFLKGGWSQTKRGEALAKRAQSAGIPATPEFIVACGYTMVVAAVCLNIPFLRRISALVLAALLPPITFVGHRFWEIEDPQQRDQNLTQVMKNATMFGGALYIAGSK
jgi:putative oxidoreductase